MHPHLCPELALKVFEADAAFNAALAEFQKGPPEATIIAEAQRAAAHGFSWFAGPSEPGFFEVWLCHKAGAKKSAHGESITALLAGLLGHPLAQDIGVIAANQAAEPEQEGERDGRDGIMIHGGGTACGSPGAWRPVPLQGEQHQGRAEASVAEGGNPAGRRLLPGQIHQEAGDQGDQHVQVAPADAEVVADAVEVAAESLAAATGGAVVLGPTEYIPDPDKAERTRLAFPLTAEQRRACVHGIKLLTAEQRKSFTIAFRDAFKVSREEKAITPLITQVRHMEFCDNFTIEAAGGVAA